MYTLFSSLRVPDRGFKEACIQRISIIILYHTTTTSCKHLHALSHSLGLLSGAFALAVQAVAAGVLAEVDELLGGGAVGGLGGEYPNFGRSVFSWIEADLGN